MAWPECVARIRDRTGCSADRCARERLAEASPLLTLPLVASWGADSRSAKRNGVGAKVNCSILDDPHPAHFVRHPPHKGEGRPAASPLSGTDAIGCVDIQVMQG